MEPKAKNSLRDRAMVLPFDRLMFYSIEIAKSPAGFNKQARLSIRPHLAARSVNPSAPLIRFSMHSYRPNPPSEAAIGQPSSVSAFAT